jgi:hypothetical protein
MVRGAQEGIERTHEQTHMPYRLVGEALEHAQRSIWSVRIMSELIITLCAIGCPLENQSIHVMYVAQ